MYKSQLRRELIARRKNMSDSVKEAKDCAIFEELVKKITDLKIELVLTYYSTNIEVDTHRLIDYCFVNNIRAAIPVIIDDAVRFFCIENLEDIGEEIVDFTNSVCIVPALAYNSGNRRIGYGGGYYDRFLKNYTGYKIGLCYEEFIMEIPVEEHDEGVDSVIWK
jgi:5-formyltetrahydrofolate cyclo-ligase